MHRSDVTVVGAGLAGLTAARAVAEAAVRVVFGAESGEVSMHYFLAYARAGGGLISLVEIENAAQETRFTQGSQQVAIALAGILGRCRATP